MKLVKLLGAAAAAMLVAACAGQSVDRVKMAQSTGSAFTQGLTDQYRQIASYEADEMYDWRDADYFARKGLRAAEGEVVLPEQVGDWDIPQDKVGEMTSARADMVALLDRSARTKVPSVAARTQGRFDCWIEQQEENHQPTHIARCREAFYAALEEMRAAMEPPAAAPAPEPEPMMEPERVTVYFGFDSDTVRAEEMTKVDAAARLAADDPDLALSVTGHADRAGPAEYNRDLSLRRAQNVRDALVAAGVAADRISIAARGESEPAVPTADGVAEPANRRVEIVVQ